MPKNDDLINDILRELDDKKDSSPAEEPAETEPVQEEPAESFEAPYTEPEPVEYDAPAEDYQPQYAEEQPYSEEQPYYQEGYPEQDMYIPPERTAPPKKKKKKRRKKQRNRLPGVLILTTLIFAVSIILSMVIIGFGKDMLGIGKSDTTKLIIVEEGATTEQIAQMLKDEGIIKSPKFFMLFSRLRKSDSLYIPGEHFIRPNMAYETIIQNLTTDEIENKESVEVTFKEGITLLEAAQILEEQGVCSKDDFLFNFNAGGYGFAFEERLLNGSNLKFYRMEGYLFPDTYFFYKDMDPEKVCQKIYLNFDQKMTEDRYKKMEDLGLTLDSLITFASIVQKEAATPDKMTLVASVFWNRLRNPDEFSKLQSDPTKNYANDVIKPNMEVYDKAMIDAYNTYEGTGLPPGAICNPGMEAIDAVLANFQSNYYYFYANIDTGETLFAETYEEHLANEEEIHRQQEEAAAAQEAQDNENAGY